jgi:tRNA(Ile)-lysidine synthase
VSQLCSVLQEFCTRNILSGCNLLVGLSGGADSVALLRGLHQISAECRLGITAVHVNHHLRGAESDADQQFVEELCSSLDIKLAISHWLPHYITSSAIEERAREFRYAQFLLFANKYQATWVLTAHHADDQVETILQRILRGTSLAGLAGIPEIRELTKPVKLARPLLNLSRRDILDYLNEQSLSNEQGTSFREDSSNRDLSYTRNYLRQFLLPELRMRLNSKCDEAILRLAEQARETHHYLESIAQQEFARGLLDDGDPIRLDRQLLANLPDIILRELLILIWKHKEYELQGMTQQHWQKMAAQIKNAQPMNQHFPHKTQVTTRDKLVLISKLS